MDLKVIKILIFIKGKWQILYIIITNMKDLFAKVSKKYFQDFLMYVIYCNNPKYWDIFSTLPYLS